MQTSPFRRTKKFQIPVWVSGIFFRQKRKKMETTSAAALCNRATAKGGTWRVAVPSGVPPFPFYELLHKNGSLGTDLNGHNTLNNRGNKDAFNCAAKILKNRCSIGEHRCCDMVTSNEIPVKVPAYDVRIRWIKQNDCPILKIGTNLLTDAYDDDRIEIT